MYEKSGSKHVHNTPTDLWIPFPRSVESEFKSRNTGSVLEWIKSLYFGCNPTQTVSRSNNAAYDGKTSILNPDNEVSQNRLPSFDVARGCVLCVLA